MNDHFLNFLNSLENKDNKIILEHVKLGFEVFLETATGMGFAVGGMKTNSEKESALDKFNNMGANLASASGNNLLNMLRESEKNLRGKYSYDTESELDGLPTSEFSTELNKKRSIPKNYKEDDLGFGIES